MSNTRPSETERTSLMYSAWAQARGIAEPVGPPGTSGGLASAGPFQSCSVSKPRVSAKASMEAFADTRGLLTEQLWNGPALANPPLVPGGPTGSAMPLAWAHAEYIKLVRSVSDGRVFDMLDVVSNRYLQPHASSTLEVWNFDRQFLSMPAGRKVRIPLATSFRLRWTRDGWNTSQDTTAIATAVGIYYVDLPTDATEAGSTLTFTFFWLTDQRWEGVNYSIGLHA